MNAMLLVMSSTLVLGADMPPAAAPAAPAPAPIIMSTPHLAGPCTSCATGICGGTSDPNPCEKTGLLAKLKAKFARSNDCGCAAPRRPIFTGFTTAACDPCTDSKPGLLARLKAKFHSSGSNCGCTAPSVGCTSSSSIPAVGGCALPPVPSAPAPVAPAPAPEKMPAPVEQPKKNAISVPIVPVAPVSGSVSRF